MKYGKVLPYVFFVVLAVSLVLLNNSSLKKDYAVDLVSTNTEKSLAREIVRILRVIDGDTIEVWINNKEEAIRLIGIDAPETVDPRKPVQCFGKEAGNKTKEMLGNQIVKLVSDSTQGNRDKYGRLLRYVFLNGVNFNKLMISQGFAHEYTHLNNPYQYQSEFKNAEKEARRKKIGLWSEISKCYN